MSTLKFKTNINCDGCVARVTPLLNGDKQITKWTVDTTNPMKILTVETSSLSEEQVISALKQVGFKGEPIQ